VTPLLAVASIAWLGFATACRTAELEPGAETVTASNAAPGRGCRSIGRVTGRGGGSGGGAWIANEDLIEYATNDARNQAFAMGTDYVHLDPPQLGAGDGTTTTATVTGTVYSCQGADPRPPRGIIAAKTADDDVAPQRRAAAPPSQAAGFQFGESPADAEQACTSAGHTWEPGAESHFHCSGTAADVGLPATVLLRFCEGELCALVLSTAPEGENGKVWSRAFADLQQALRDKYGQPAVSEGKERDECAGRLYDCLVAGTVERHVGWSWESGERIDVRMDSAGGAGPQIRVEYRLSTRRRPKKDAL
jgi:hypothetical protein